MGIKEATVTQPKQRPNTGTEHDDISKGLQLLTAEDHKVEEVTPKQQPQSAWQSAPARRLPKRLPPLGGIHTKGRRLLARACEVKHLPSAAVLEVSGLTDSKSTHGC